ncbi:hemerythrin domain-containing protein [Geodermatophilus poikilotrophus]|uniref:Hemerythrin HHE cation binding domain-containing protein n=1 Tax=Geodermatophilus poikilotrophus TaxID=1333667 RepID=A0A1I0CLE7_9ACTN|nr:hemerythrin domain-containing protein [Geodermatophilus poikilotrophus]SET20287.1 Hemerythrin HHE cation binding domain-containing protein [Geodermatophilus poikilotrophus]
MPAAAALRRPSALRTPTDDPPADVPAPRAVASELLLHRLVRRELRLLAELSAWASADDVERTRELTRHADLLGRLLLHHHATERELVWPALLRAAPAARPLVAQWTARVAGLDDRLRGLSTAARQWAVACSDKARDAFTLACLDTADAVAEQTAEEERDLLPLLAAHLSPAAWAEVTGAARCPLSRRERSLVLGLALEDACAGDRARLLAGLPTSTRLAWRLAGRRRYRAAVVRLRGAPPAA